MNKRKKNILIAQVGTSNLQNTKYSSKVDLDNGQENCIETKYSFEAIIREIKKRRKSIDYLLLIGTIESRYKDIFDYYSQKMKYDDSHVVWQDSSITVNKEEKEQLLSEVIGTSLGIPALEVRIAVTGYGVNTDELNDNFDILRETMGKVIDHAKSVNQFEVYFDISNGFRSIPIYIYTMINYLVRVREEEFTLHMYYGMFEAKKKYYDVAPLVDLSHINELMEWINAANTFMRYGNASMIKEVFEQKYNSLPKEEKPEWSSLKKMVNKVENLSDTIQTCRGADGTELEMKARKKNKCSVKSAYALFREELSQKEEREQTSMKPLVPLFEKVKEKFSVFEKENNYEVGMAVTAWSIENGMIQQGYTSLEETIKTWICHNYELNEVDERNREGIVGFIINEMKQQEIQNPKKDWRNPDIRWEAVCPIVEKKLQGNNNQDDSELLEKMERMVKELDFNLVILAREIKNKRNDINHFGMRKNPMEASGLKSELEKYFIQFREIVERKEAAVDDGTMERSF
ncbi:MAG: TIGR02221 family CRISPR-associated protein [Lachnospiraceae bacterium]|nr:TIGR02221 family CRISPR-associated protein [Lachnospiraceae bacterium]